MKKYMLYALIILSSTFYYGAYVLGFVLFCALMWKDKTRVQELFRCEGTVGFLLLVLLFSTLFSKNFTYSLAMDALILLHVMIYIVLLDYIKETDIEDIIRFMNIVGIGICLFGLYQYFSGNLIINPSWTDKGLYGSLVRIYSTLRNPNIFAGYLGFNLCFAAAYHIRRKQDSLTATNIILSSVCLILTYSRGGFIAFAVGILIVCILYKDLKCGVYLLLMIGAFYGYNTIESSNRTDLGMLPFDSSSLYRLEIWKASLGLFKENIAFGSGPGSVLMQLSRSSDKLKGLIMHAHSIPLHLLAETGLLGLTAFLLVVVSWISRAIGYCRCNRCSEQSYIAVGFLGAVSAMLVHGMVDSIIFVPSRSLIFLVYLSLFPAVYSRVGLGRKMPATSDLKY